MSTPKVRILQATTDPDMTHEGNRAAAAIASALTTALPGTLKTTWIINEGVIYLIIEWMDP